MKLALMIGLAVASLCLMPLADALASDAARWGITPKRKAAEEQKQSEPSPENAAPENTTAAPTAEPKPTAPPPAEAAGANSQPAPFTPKIAEPTKEGGDKPAAPPAGASSPKPAAPVTETGRKAAPPATFPQPAKAPAPKAPANEAAVKDKAVEPKIAWASDQQKQVCEAYLKDLQEHFMKARHFSIQGVPCNTAEHSSAFLSISEKCRQDCPPGLLEQKGYTPRIVRNITYLEKLGKDRCVER
jgi:hypothetical protein